MLKMGYFLTQKVKFDENEYFLTQKVENVEKEYFLTPKAKNVEYYFHFIFYITPLHN